MSIQLRFGRHGSSRPTAAVDRTTDAESTPALAPGASTHGVERCAANSEPCRQLPGGS